MLYMKNYIVKIYHKMVHYHHGQMSEAVAYRYATQNRVVEGSTRLNWLKNDFLTILKFLFSQYF